MNLFQILFYDLRLPGNVRKRRLILLDQRLQKDEGLPHGQGLVLGLFQLRRKHILPIANRAAQVLADALSRVLACLVQSPGGAFQPVLEGLIIAGLKDLPKDSLPLPRIGQQELQKVPLGDHGDLGKLAPVHAQDLPHGGGDLPLLRHDPSVGVMELRIGLLGGGAVAPFGGTRILRIAFHRVLLVPVGKGQHHKGGRFRLCVL